MSEATEQHLVEVMNVSAKRASRILELEEKITALQTKYNEAVEALRFYANKEHIRPNNQDEFVQGKTARTLLSKHTGSQEQ